MHPVESLAPTLSGRILAAMKIPVAPAVASLGLVMLIAFCITDKFVFFPGLLLIIGALPGCVRRLPEPWCFWRYSLACVGTGAICLGLSVLSTLPFFYMYDGESIRPMWHSAVQFMLQCTALMAMFWYGPWHVNSQAPRWIGWLGVVLCLSPLPAGQILFEAAKSYGGFTMSD
jgi:hypothetical protein